MKKIFIVLYFFFFVYEGESQNRLYSGGFGHFFTGPAYSNAGELKSYLERNDVLGENTSMRVTGVIIGGQGLAFTGGKYLIGGSGFTVNLGRSSFAKGYSDAVHSGGMFNFGFTFVKKCDLLAYVYGGIGTGTFVLTVSNKDTNGVYFDKQTPLQPNKRKSYALTGSAYELVVGMKKILSGTGCSETTFHKGGLMLGFDLGINYELGYNGWENNSIGPPSFDPFVLFFRVTIGGGAFHLEENKNGTKNN